jgi:hypothetical protein
MSDLKLIYKSNRRDCISQLGIAQPILTSYASALDVGSPGDIVEWQWPINDSLGLLGTSVKWNWDLQSDDYVSSAEQEEIIIDTRYDWNVVESQNLTVYMAYKDDTVQSEVLAIGEDTLRYLRSLEIPTESYRIFIYRDNQLYNELFNITSDIADLAGMEHRRSNSTISTGFSSEEWRSSPLFKGTVAHEITHAALSDFEFSCDQYIPKWFTEGYAAYVEGIIAPDSLADKVANAKYMAHVQIGGVLPINAWGKDSTETLLYYSQSKYLFDYLIATYGDDKPHAVRLAISTKTDFEEAFAEVYGFPLSELGGKFTEYMNRNLLAHQQIPSNDTSPQNEHQDMSQAIIPTIVPLTVKTGLNQPEANNRLNIYLTMLVLAISIVMIGIGKKIWSKRRTNKSTHGADLLHSQDGQHTSTSHNQSDNADKQAHGDDR